MLLSVLSFLVVAQSSSEVPEGLMNNPVFINFLLDIFNGFVCACIFPDGQLFYYVSFIDSDKVRCFVFS